MAKPKLPAHVFPIRGLIGVGFSDTEHEVETEEELDAHLASGAFALSAKEAEERSPLPPIVIKE